MPGWGWVIIIVIVVAVLGGLAWMAWMKSRTNQLRREFGPEYDRTIDESESRRDAESELDARRKRRAAFDVRPLSAASRQRYAKLWVSVQARFVDDPIRSVNDADRLITEVLRERGYPMEEFGQRAADISVDYPDVVANYRSGHEVSVAAAKGSANTDDLRRAMQNYRSLFDELLEPDSREVRRAW
jgi:hypothetical protein